MIRKSTVTATLVAIVTLPCAAAPAVAQETSTLAPGTVVRWQGDADGRAKQGRVERASADSLTVRVVVPPQQAMPGTTTSYTFALADVTLERSTGRPGRSSAAAGLLVGATAGAIVGLATHEPCTGEGFLACFGHPSPAESVIATGLFGGLVGAVIGYAVAPRRWESVSGVGRTSLSVAPGGAIRTAVSLAR